LIVRCWILDAGYWILEGENIFSPKENNIIARGNTPGKKMQPKINSLKGNNIFYDNERIKP